LLVVPTQRGKHACAYPLLFYPHMPPQFETVKVGNHVPVLYQSKTTSPQQSFVNVLITPDGVETSSFLEAADGLMDLFGKFIIPSQQLRLSLNPFLPIKISWAALSLHSSRRISEITLPYVRPRPFPEPRTPPRPFFFVGSKRAAFQGVRTRYNAHKSVSETLENLVQAEAREGGTQGTACLVRLTR
jgi:hypothetical protein